MKTITIEQQRELKGLLFWLREKRIAENTQNENMLVSAKENIKHRIKMMDLLEIPFSIQNVFLNLSVEYIHSDILDVMKKYKIQVSTI